VCHLLSIVVNASQCADVALDISGRVCVPVNPDTADEFNPEDVPCLASLVSEIDAYDKENGSDDREGRTFLACASHR
jgi:hypothetical protein